MSSAPATSTLLVTDVEHLTAVVEALRTAAEAHGCTAEVRTLAGDPVDTADAMAAAARDRARHRLPTPVRVELVAAAEGTVADAEAVLRTARAGGLSGGATVDEVRRTHGR